MNKKVILTGMISLALLTLICFGWSRSFSENGDAPLTRGIRLENGWVAETDIKPTGVACDSITIHSTYKGLPFIYGVHQKGCQGEYKATNKTAKVLNAVTVIALTIVIAILSTKFLNKKPNVQ